MRLIRDVNELDAAGLAGRCVLVPTMGALHEGHLSLIRLGVSEARRRGLDGGCIASIFVNPAQFNDPRDFERYPRSVEADAEACRACGASAVFAPSVEGMYPGGAGASVGALPPVATEPGLEDAHRPGHLPGVARVINRLFELVQPGAAIFGEKDWQQLRLVSALAQERAGPAIVGGATVREADGLAMSSRNLLLSKVERNRAGALYRALVAAGEQASPRASEAAMREVLDSAGVRTEYAVVRDARTLMPLGHEAQPGEPTVCWGECRALIAAWVGETRLIDNAPWPGPIDATDA